MKPLRSQLLLRQKERWEIMTHTRLSPYQQMDEEEPKRLPPHSPDYRPP